MTELTVDEGISSNPEQQKAQEVFLSNTHHAQPSLPGNHLRGALRTSARVSLGRVLADVAVALERGDGGSRGERCEEVEREPGPICQADDAGDEASKAGCKLWRC